MLKHANDIFGKNVGNTVIGEKTIRETILN